MEVRMALVSGRTVGVRAAVCACVAALVLAASGTSTGARAVQATARKVYVSVLDKAGAPVKDMTAADFEVKENGKVQTITVQPATNPLRVAVIVSDGGIGAYQGAAGVLMDRLKANAEFKLFDVAEQPMPLTPEYTNDVPKLSAAVQTLTRRSSSKKNGQVMEAVNLALKDVAAEGKRPVIVVLRLGGEATSTLRASNLRELMRKAGARLHVLTPQGATGMGGGMGQAGMTSSEGSQNFIEISQLLEDGSRESGGRHDQYSAASLAKTMQSLADELLSQYEISYTLADGAKPSDKLQVATKRKDVKVYAPSKIAN
jgi:VWFA-related protein